MLPFSSSSFFSTKVQPTRSFDDYSSRNSLLEIRSPKNCYTPMKMNSGTKPMAISFAAFAGRQRVRREAAPGGLLQVSIMLEGCLQLDELPVHLRVRSSDRYLHTSDTRYHQLRSSFTEEIQLPVTALTKRVNGDRAAPLVTCDQARLEQSYARNAPNRLPMFAFTFTSVFAAARSASLRAVVFDCCQRGPICSPGSQLANSSVCTRSIAALTKAWLSPSLSRWLERIFPPLSSL